MHEDEKYTAVPTLRIDEENETKGIKIIEETCGG